MRQNHDFPIFKEITIIPVATMNSDILTNRDSFDIGLTRNVLLMKDSAGNTGISEMIGGDAISAFLSNIKLFLIGKQISEYKNILSHIKYAFAELHFSDEKYIGSTNKMLNNSICAIEIATLDLIGKQLNVSIAALLSEGQQRHKVTLAGDLFFIGDNKSLLYRNSNSEVDWYRLRTKKADNSDTVTRLAEAAFEKYGFKHWNLNGGFLTESREFHILSALASRFPEASISFNANHHWSIYELIRHTKQMNKELSFISNPCAPIEGLSARETFAELKRRISTKIACQDLAQDWRRFGHIIALHAVDICLIEPTNWLISECADMAKLCHEWGIGWGMNVKPHLDISLATYVQIAAASKGDIQPLITPWIWQEGDAQLTKKPLLIEQGAISVPNSPGLGVEIDMNKLMKAHESYKKFRKYN